MTNRMENLEKIKEDYEKIERQKIDYLFQKSKEDINIQQKLTLYTSIFNFIGSTSDNKTIMNLYDYSYQKCTSFIDLCYKDVKSSNDNILEIYIHMYQLIKRYLSFSASIFNSLYKKLELMNVFIIKSLIDYQKKCYDEIQKEIVIALNDELKRARDAFISTSEVIDAVFESLVVYSINDNIRLEKVNNEYRYTWLSRVNTINYQLPDEIAKSIFESLINYLSALYINHQNDSISDYIQLCIRLYSFEQFRVSKFYPSLKDKFIRKYKSILLKPVENQLFDEPVKYLTLLLNNNAKETVEILVEIYSTKSTSVQRIVLTIRAFLLEKLAQLKEQYTIPSHFFDQMNTLIQTTDVYVNRIICQYPQLCNRLIEDISTFIKPIENEYIIWLVDRIHNMIIKCQDRYELKNDFALISHLFKYVTNTKNLTDTYEDKFKFRNLNLHIDHPYINEELAINYIEEIYNYLLMFDNLGHLNYDIVLGENFKDNYKPKHNLFNKLLVINKDRWGIAPKAYDDWTYFAGMLIKYAPCFKPIIDLSDALYKDYNKIKKDIRFLPSYNTFDIELTTNKKSVELVLNGWQLLFLSVVQAYSGKVHIKTVETILKKLPLSDLTNIINTFERNGIIYINNDNLIMDLNRCNTVDKDRLILADIEDEKKEVRTDIAICEGIEIDKYAIPPKIVKILKDNGSLGYDELYIRVKEFKDIIEEEFKDCVDSLLEKDLIQRCEINPDLLVFNR